MAREEEIYTGFCERWRSIPKPTIAQVHGRCIAGGLMLIWPCDLVIASDDSGGLSPDATPLLSLHLVPGIGPRLIRACSVSPSTNSMTIQGLSPDSSRP